MYFKILVHRFGKNVGLWREKIWQVNRVREKLYRHSQVQISSSGTYRMKNLQNLLHFSFFMYPRRVVELQDTRKNSKFLCTGLHYKIAAKIVNLNKTELRVETHTKLKKSNKNLKWVHSGTRKSSYMNVLLKQKKTKNGIDFASQKSVSFLRVFK